MLANTPTQPIVLPTILVKQQSLIRARSQLLIETFWNAASKVKQRQKLDNSIPISYPDPPSCCHLTGELSCLNVALSEQHSERRGRRSTIGQSETMWKSQRVSAAEVSSSRSPQSEEASPESSIRNSRVCDLRVRLSWCSTNREGGDESALSAFLPFFPFLQLLCEQFHHGLLARAPPRCETRFPIPHLSYLTPSSVKPTSHLVSNPPANLLNALLCQTHQQPPCVKPNHAHKSASESNQQLTQLL